MTSKHSPKTLFADKGINGLMNIGNTCYINTSIQCLGHCTNFLHYVLSGKFDRTDGILMNELRELFMELWINNNGVIPNRFLKHLKTSMTSMNINEQNDIQEFLTMFIDKLNASISEKVNPDTILESLTYTDTYYDKLRKKMDRSWIMSMCREYSSLLEYFYGQTVMQIICGKCNKIHHNYEPFSILTLPIPNEQSGLMDCLKHYAKTEYLNSDVEEWKCDGCESCTKSIKTMKFWKLPKVVSICFKRFTFTENDLRKNNAFVDIPEEISFDDYVIGPSITKYELCSVACHIGSFTNGHYYAVCKNPNGTWFRIDDTNITKLSTKFETPNMAYVAFYQEKTEIRV